MVDSYTASPKDTTEVSNPSSYDFARANTAKAKAQEIKAGYNPSGEPYAGNAINQAYKLGDLPANKQFYVSGVMSPKGGKEDVATVHYTSPSKSSKFLGLYEKLTGARKEAFDHRGPATSDEKNAIMSAQDNYNSALINHQRDLDAKGNENSQYADINVRVPRGTVATGTVIDERGNNVDFRKEGFHPQGYNSQSDSALAKEPVQISSNKQNRQPSIWDRLGQVIGKGNPHYEKSVKEAGSQATVSEMMSGYDSGQEKARRDNPEFARAMDSYKSGDIGFVKEASEKSVEGYESANKFSQYGDPGKSLGPAKDEKASGVARWSGNPRPDLATAEERQRLSEYFNNRSTPSGGSLPGAEEIEALKVYSEAAKKDREVENQRRDAEANRDYLPDAAKKEYERSPEERNRFASDEKGSNKALDQYKSVHFPTDEQRISRTLEGAEKVRDESYEKARAESADRFWSTMGNTEGRGYTSAEFKDSAQQSSTPWSEGAGLERNARINELQREEFEKSYRPPETGVAQGSGSASRQMDMRALYKKRLGDIRGNEAAGKEAQAALMGGSIENYALGSGAKLAIEGRSGQNALPSGQAQFALPGSARQAALPSGYSPLALPSGKDYVALGSGSNPALGAGSSVKELSAEAAQADLRSDPGYVAWMKERGFEGALGKGTSPALAGSSTLGRSDYDTRTHTEAIDDTLRNSGFGSDKRFEYKADEKLKFGPKPQEGKDSKFWGKPIDYKIEAYEKDWEKSMDTLEKQGLAWDQYRRMEDELLKKHDLTREQVDAYDRGPIEGEESGHWGQLIPGFDSGPEEGKESGHWGKAVPGWADESKLKDIANKLTGEYKSMKDKFDNGKAPDRADYDRALGYENDLRKIGPEGEELLKKLQKEAYQHPATGARLGVNPDGTLVNDFTRSDMSEANSNIGKDGKYALSGARIKKDDLGDGLGYNAIRLTPEDKKTWASRANLDGYISEWKTIKPLLEKSQKLAEQYKSTGDEKVALEGVNALKDYTSQNINLLKKHDFMPIGEAVVDALIREAEKQDQQVAQAASATATNSPPAAAALA